MCNRVQLPNIWHYAHKEILARNQVGRHSMYSGHHPRIFATPKNARNAETKRQSGAVPILLLVIPASTTSAYSSLNVLQELNHYSATSAVCCRHQGGEARRGEGHHCCCHCCRATKATIWGRGAGGQQRQLQEERSHCPHHYQVAWAKTGGKGWQGDNVNESSSSLLLLSTPILAVE